MNSSTYISHGLILLSAGFAAGLGGTVAGIASIFSYPALLLVGLNPIEANVTNSISLTLLGVGGSFSSKPEWSPHKKVLKRLIPFYFVGGIVGATLLLRTPNSTFKAVVPFLLLTSSTAILLPKSPQKSLPSRNRTRIFLLVAALIGIYCGYFGAASGGMSIALLMQMYGLAIPAAHAIKNVLLAIANGVAALIFAFSGHVHWLAALPLAIGFFFGGRLGPKIVRNTRQDLIKYLVAAAGASLAIYLLLKG